MSSEVGDKPVLAVTEERELVERMRRGDQQAFNIFFDQYVSRLAAFAARRSALDATALEDVVQQTMIKAVRNLQGFRGEASLLTWLCQICRHQLADLRRADARRPPLESLDQLTESGAPALPSSLVSLHDPLHESGVDSEVRAVRRIANQLPARYVQILELRFGDELTLPAIARILHLTDDAAESLLVRAKRAFRELWTAAERNQA
jgi:RNA polymerase sigma-70 factor (ECF subfamily)